ncbi:MAG TPA: hypothetical protein VFU32_11170 [Ktedonobacterales bacterium]|nr:hypothetical protein [Ktedonobacterales bacterium]
MKRFASIDWLDNAILYALELIASVSVLFLAGGLIASVANVLTSGEIISSSEFGKQFYAWSQAIGIDASIPGVILRLVVYGKQKEWFRCGVYTILSLLVLFTAFNISNVESMTQTLNTPLVDGYSHSLVSVDVLVTIRSLTVILLIVSHALKHLHTEATQPVKVVKPKGVQPTAQPQTQPVQPVQSVAPVVNEERTPREPTPINTNFMRVKEYLDNNPNASAREVGRALGFSATTAAKWVNKVRSA